MVRGATKQVLVLRAPGINCDREVAAACELAGAHADRVHINRLAAGEVSLLDYAALILPGGFSYGDHMGGGRLLAVDLVHRLGDYLQRFVADGRPVLGICNGFQVLVKAGLLPGLPAGLQEASLIANQRGRYECRWVRLVTDPQSPCIFTKGIDAPFELPVGHGEGRFIADEQTLAGMAERHQLSLRYLADSGAPAEGYPDNPNGSHWAVAGICNPSGTVFGLMPHPDRAFLPQHHPQWRRQGLRKQGPGMPIFRNLVRYLSEQ